LGAKTIETAIRLAEAEEKPLYSVISDPYSYGPLEKPAMKLLQFSAMIEGLAELLDTGITLSEFYDEVLDKTGYVAMLESKPTEENKTRLENVRELKSSINAYAENAELPTLAGFLEEIALYTDLEEYNDSDDAAVMMTMHSAKGLEFPHVFLVGFEDGLFPGMRAIGDQEEMEEERRLCYVAITRAKQTLTITHAKQRMLYGRTNSALKSRFLREIPEDCVVFKGGTKIRSEADKERALILAEANKQSQVLRGEGDAEAARIYAEAFSKSPEFFSFQRGLEALRKSLGENTRMILTPDSPLLQPIK
jgi:DNA helicase-2/ATP-dependent DNA helicase PcrA